MSVMELYETLRLEKKFRNFTELYNGADGTEQLWLKTNSKYIVEKVKQKEAITSLQ